MAYKRKIVEIDEERCNGCGQCASACAEGAIEIVDGKARLVAEKYCDGLGACLGECPMDALKVTEREADEFDPEAVEHYLKMKEDSEKSSAPQAPCGCPSVQVRIFEAGSAGAEAGQGQGCEASALSHWPVKIKLVPPGAPFLKGADLLVAADCAPVAYPNFHHDFLNGKVVLTGCPKFDDVPAYIEKFTEIFRGANVRSITVLDMEVPCCSALPAIVRKALATAGKEIPMEEITISVRGKILKKVHA